ncbi:MAG: hypothetical protein IJ733_14570 [Lachnospiraceae bacterium]|nr:hypothetical protein [Lachnospiraceae bacterium]
MGRKATTINLAAENREYLESQTHFQTGEAIPMVSVVPGAISAGVLPAPSFI